MRLRSSVSLRSHDPGSGAGEPEFHQRLEFETDVIASHVLTLGKSPDAQFAG